MIPKACTLTPDGRVDQVSRFERIRSEVDSVQRTPTVLTVRFRSGVDEVLLEELIATERECCAFLDIAYAGYVLRIGSDDPHDLDPFEALVR
ncbi:MAG: hypothetical protein H0W87_06745 [Actinobacteria bacterium]|nr:hypothetical protein [Actinomycetota bacterium]